MASRCRHGFFLEITSLLKRPVCTWRAPSSSSRFWSARAVTRPRRRPQGPRTHRRPGRARVRSPGSAVRSAEPGSRFGIRGRNQNALKCGRVTATGASDPASRMDPGHPGPQLCRTAADTGHSAHRTTRLPNLMIASSTTSPWSRDYPEPFYRLCESLRRKEASLAHSCR